MTAMLDEPEGLLSRAQIGIADIPDGEPACQLRIAAERRCSKAAKTCMLLFWLLEIWRKSAWGPGSQYDIMIDWMSMDHYFVSESDFRTGIRRLARRCARLLLLVVAAPALIGASASATLEIEIADLRSDRGMLHVCLSPNPGSFLECQSDPEAHTASVPANRKNGLRFENLAPGAYVLSVVHDENGNGELDKFLFIPKEGFGFSRNPPIKMGPPRSEDVKFSLTGGVMRQQIEMKYLL